MACRAERSREASRAQAPRERQQADCRAEDPSHREAPLAADRRARRVAGRRVVRNPEGRPGHQAESQEEGPSRQERQAESRREDRSQEGRPGHQAESRREDHSQEGRPGHRAEGRREDHSRPAAHRGEDHSRHHREANREEAPSHLGELRHQADNRHHQPRSQCLRAWGPILLCVENR